MAEMARLAVAFVGIALVTWWCTGVDDASAWERLQDAARAVAGFVLAVWRA